MKTFNPVLLAFRRSHEKGYGKEFIEGFMSTFVPGDRALNFGNHAYKVLKRMEYLYSQEDKK